MTRLPNKYRKSASILLALWVIALAAGCAAPATTVETPAAPQEETASQTAVPTDAAPEEETDTVPCDLPLPGPEDWPVWKCDRFDDNRNDWQVESQDNDYARYAAFIEDGKYVVDYTAKVFAAFQRSALTWFDVGDARDFAMSVTGTMDTRFQDVSWGVAFRGGEEKASFFLFSIRHDGSYVFEIFENNTWIPLVGPRSYNGIRKGGENTLRILAEGPDFRFFINGEEVEGFEGGRLEGMEIMLVVSAKEGTSANFLFDDLVLQI